jgi:hypothetical protein
VATKYWRQQNIGGNKILALTKYTRRQELLASTKYWRQQNVGVNKIRAVTKYGRRQNLGVDKKLARCKNRNLTSTDCIDQYNWKIESVSEDRSIGPFAHLCL